TDWWAKMNVEGGESDRLFLSLMIRAQNDVYMVDADSATRKDDGPAALENGTLTRGEIQRCAMNLCRYLLRTHAMERFLVNGNKAVEAPKDVTQMECIVTLDKIARNGNWRVDVAEAGTYVLTFQYAADGAALAQIPIRYMVNSHQGALVMIKATEGELETTQVNLELVAGTNVIRMTTNTDNLKVEDLKLYR
ncbi:MAG: hypothetical protein IJC29_02060, partial [Clostridia bacterium]|nr:hypothetical protein [Clostridia bacterium]